VKMGERVGQMWVITEGIQPGEQVIAEGIQKAKEGMLVRPRQFAPIAAKE
jgi:multidrug efflux pump subunit AcrA (membrane-fusion protein)